MPLEPTIDLLEEIGQAGAKDAGVDVRERVFQNLTTIGPRNGWVSACKSAVEREDESWLNRYCAEYDGAQSPWFLRRLHKVEGNPRRENRVNSDSQSLLTRLRIAQSIADAAMSALLLKRLSRGGANDSLIESLAAVIYRAAVRWQPLRQVAEVALLPDRDTAVALRNSLLVKGTEGPNYRAALSRLQSQHAGWEVAPVSELLAHFFGEAAGRWESLATLNVPLVRLDGSGLVARLELESRSNGSTAFFRDPVSMSFLQYDNGFKKALDSAWAYARRTLSVNGSDVRWRLRSAAQDIPSPVIGGSIGACMAVGLSSLFADEPNLDYGSGWAITGTVNEQGVIGTVNGSGATLHDGYREKLSAVAGQHLKLVVPGEDWQQVRDSISTDHIKVLKGATTVKEASDIIVDEERSEKRKRHLKKLATISTVVAFVLFLAASAAAVYAWNQKSIAVEKGNQLAAAKEQLEIKNGQLTASNEKLTSTVAQLDAAKKQLQEKNLVLGHTNVKLAQQKTYAESQRQIAEVARGNERLQRENAEAQRRVAEAARDEEERQRERAEGLEKLASAQRQIAVARQAELQADRAMAENNPASAQLLYAKALTLDERMDTRGRYLQARAKPFMKLVWSASVNYDSSPIALSPDGKLLATGKEDSSLALLNADTGEKAGSLINERSTGISSVAFSPDGQHLAAAGANGIITIWDYRSGKQVRELLSPGCTATSEPEAGAEAQEDGDDADDEASEGGCDFGQILIAYSKDGSSLAAEAAGNPVITVWDVASGKIISSVSYPSILPSDFAFDRKGNLIAADLVGSIWILSLNRGSQTNLNHNAKILSSAVSPDGTLLATAGDNLIRVWDLDARREVTKAPLRQNSVTKVSFTADGRHIVSASSDGIIKLWETSSWREVLSFSGGLKEVDSIALDQNDRLFVRSALGTIKCWGLTQGRAAASLGRALGTTADVAFSRDGTSLASLVLAQNTQSLSINIWDVRTRQVSRQINLNKLLKTASRMAAISDESSFYLPPVTLQFSVDGKFIVLGGMGPNVPVIDAQTGEPLAPFGSPKKDGYHFFSSISFSPEGRRLAAADDDGAIHVWDASTKSEERLLTGHEGPITCIRFSPDGTAISSGSMDGTIRVWDVATGKTSRVLGQRGPKRDFPILSLDYSPDGKRIAVTSMDQKVRVWDLASGQEVINHESFDMTVMSLAFSPNGRWLAWGSLGESAVHLLDVAKGEEVPPVRVAAGTVTRMSFSPDGNWLAMAGGDGELHLWNMAEVENSYKSSPAVLLNGAESDTGLSLMVSANSFTGDAMTTMEKAELYTALGLATESNFTIVAKTKEQGQGTENCTPVPVVATLNPFPTSFINPAPPCHNFPALDARIVDGDKYSGNEVVRTLGRNAKIGDTVRVRIYVDNGAANNMHLQQVVARNVKVESWVDTAPGPEHSIKVSLAGDNTNTISRTFVLRTEGNSVLQVIPNSGQVRDWQNKIIRDKVQLGGNTFTIGDLAPGFATDLFLYFDVKVVAADKALATELLAQPHRPVDGENSLISSAQNKGRTTYCPNPPKVATLNPFPISFASANKSCTDFPPLDLGIAGKYSKSEEEWNSERQVKAGDEFFVLVYIDNGAANNRPLSQTMAKNIRVTTIVDTSVGSRHSVGVSFGGDNTNTVSKSLTVRTEPDEFLEIIPNSGMLFDPFGLALQNNLQIGNNIATLGDMAPGFETNVFLRFKVRVKSARGKAGSQARDDEGSVVTLSRNKGLTSHCRNPPSVATLNPFPLNFGDDKAPCTNYPLVDLRLASGGKYSQNEEEWNQGRTAKAGDELYVLMYIDNGAANDLPLAQTLARNVKVTTSVDTGVGPEHYVSVSARGDNTNVVSKTLPIRTGGDDFLEVVPNSGEVFNQQASPLKANIELGNNTYLVGDIKPGFETDLFLRFKIRVKSANQRDATPPTYKEDSRISRDVNKGAAQSCPNPSKVATLNPFPLTFSSPPGWCLNYPPLDLYLGGRYSRNEEELNVERKAKSGDEFYAMVYIDNGAANNLPLRQTMARNVQVTTVVDTSVGSRHTVSVSFKGDNTNTVSKSLTVVTAPDEFLEVIPNSGEIFDWKTVLLKSNVQLGNNTYSVGDIGPGFETDLFLRFKVRVKSTRSRVDAPSLSPEDARVTLSPNKGQAKFCPNPLIKATLNPFPLTFTAPAEDCKNYPPIDVRLATEDGRYSQSEEDWKDGIRAKVGDELYVALYIDNGAVNSLPLSATLARNVKVTTGVDTLTGPMHLVLVTFAGENTNTVSDTFPIYTDPDSFLQVVPNSGQIRNFNTTKILKDNLQIGNNTIGIGDLAPGFETDLFIRFTIRVIQNKEKR